jgi:hypothetical protein
MLGKRVSFVHGKTKTTPDSFVAADIYAHLSSSDFLLIYILYFIHGPITTLINVFENVLDGYKGTAKLDIIMSIPSFRKQW